MTMSDEEAAKYERTERLFRDLPCTAPVRLEKEYALDTTDEGFTALVTKSKHLATNVFRSKGNLPLTFLLYCKRHPTRVVDRGGVFMTSVRGADDEDVFDAHKEMVATLALPTLVKFGGADAAVFLSEIWVSRPKPESDQIYERASQDPHREEALYVSVQTKKRNSNHLGIIKRFPPHGATITWEDMPAETKMEGRFSNLLQEIELPSEVEAVLAETIEEQRKERSKGTS